MMKPDGKKVRLSGTPTLNNKRAAEQAERAHVERALRPSVEPTRKEVPTLGEFAETFLETYAKANNKPSEQSSKRLIIKLYLRPQLGTKRLDQVGKADVEALKVRMLAAKKRPKTVNNVLAVLSRMLRWAHELELIERAPCIKLLKVPPQGFDFLTEEEYRKLREAAAGDPDMLVAFLLGADAGLRRGEILGLCWEDVETRASKLVVRRSDWYGKEMSPKGGKERVIPMTPELRAALVAVRHLRGPRVLVDADGRPWTIETLRWRLDRLCERAGLRRVRLHALRHTFCSHLAQHGAPAAAIQRLAGHQSVTTTERYMHLGPSAVMEAAALLANRGRGRGNHVATETTKARNPLEFRAFSSDPTGT